MADLQVVRLEAFVVRPGDTLLVRVHPEISQEELERVKAIVEEQLPGVKALILGVAQFAAYKPESADG